MNGAGLRPDFRDGRPSHILLARVLGMLQLVLGMVVRERALDRNRSAAEAMRVPEVCCKDGP
jgi:hypothetical protein